MRPPPPGPDAHQASRGRSRHLPGPTRSRKREDCRRYNLAAKVKCEPAFDKEKEFQLVQNATRQDWSTLSHGDCVTVAEAGLPAYDAIVDVIAEDRTSIWVRPISGATRKVFDSREAVLIRRKDGAEPASGDAAPPIPTYLGVLLATTI